MDTARRISFAGAVRRVRMTGAVLLLAFAAACGGDGPTDPGTQNPNGTITATVEGAAWNGSAAAIALRTNGFLSIGGTQGNQTNITFAFPATGPGTYAIPTVVGLNFNYSEFATGRLWQAVGMGTLGGVGSGSVTITALNDERVTGTFSFTAPAASSSSATGTRTVTNGAFNIRF